jgi:hypothetical protein
MILRRVITVGVIGLLVACKDGGGTGGGDKLEARYDLQLVNNQMLPLVTGRATFGQAKLEVLSAFLVPLSRGMLLDIVTYQVTETDGRKQSPYADTIALAYTFSRDQLTLQRPQFNGELTAEVWTHAEGTLRGSRTFTAFSGMQTARFSSVYVATP